MSEQTDLFSVRSQRAVLWWGIGFAFVYVLAFALLLQQIPLKNPAWTPDHVADWYVHNQLRVKWGAIIGSWTGAFMMPILAVVAVQMARVEGGWRIWSVLSLVSGAFFSLTMALPPLLWGVAAYTAPRKDAEVTTLMHELANLTMTTTTQFYIFIFIGVTVMALRPATQLVKHNPFPRWFGYLTLWIAIMFEAGAFAFIPRSGPFAWNGLLVYWIPLSLFPVWIAVQSYLIFKALNAQEAEAESATPVPENAAPV